MLEIEQSMELYEPFLSTQATVVFIADKEISIQYSAAGEFFELIIGGFNERETSRIVQRIKNEIYNGETRKTHSR